MHNVVPDDRSNVSTHEDRRAFHPGAFHCSPWPFPFGVRNIIPFDTRSVPALIGAGSTGPLGIDPNLRIADPVIANHDMGGIECADSAAIGRRIVKLNAKSFDPDPVATHDIEGAVELRRLPCVL